ncbi:MAG: molecular chaperone TorD family protein [Desulfitobacterium hafniense]|nr:molecular chaperone TorD family protein [Desulfitobacterium hafniense]
MKESTTAELYLSFATIFHRPHPEVVNHLEELIELWEEEIPDIMEPLAALKKFCQIYAPGETRINTLWEHYIPLFETGSVEAPPFASIYLSGDGLVLGTETIAVQTFYNSAGYAMGEKAEQLPDHLAIELEFLALLARDGEEVLLENFRQKHLIPFLTKILPRIKNGSRPVYSSVAQILQSWQLG